MKALKANPEKLISTIYEYQRFIKLNKSFIEALEEEGGDTTNLKKEISRLEGKINELKSLGGYTT